MSYACRTCEHPSYLGGSMVCQPTEQAFTSAAECPAQTEDCASYKVDERKVEMIKRQDARDRELDRADTEVGDHV
jgi:hypothetical protein